MVIKRFARDGSNAWQSVKKETEFDATFMLDNCAFLKSDFGHRNLLKIRRDGFDVPRSVLKLK
jgi:hypothetical protein